MDWDKLRAFISVVEQGNIVRAARILGVSASATTRQIQSLENHLRTDLFIRTKKGLKLTPHGELLLSKIAPFAKQVTAVEKIILQGENHICGKISISLSPSCDPRIIFPYIKEFSQKYPNVHIDYAVESYAENFEQETKFLISPYIASKKGFIQEPFINLPLCLYGSQEYLSKYGVPTCLEDLDAHKLIAIKKEREREENPLNWHLDAGKCSTEERTPFLTADSYSALIAAAEQVGGLICLSPTSIDQNKSRLVKVLPEINLPSLQLYLVYLKGGLKFSTHNSFYMFLKEEMKN